MNATDLLEIARRLDRLSPSRTNPHAFFEERSELADTLKRWAADMRATPTARRPVPVSQSPQAQPETRCTVPRVSAPASSPHGGAAPSPSPRPSPMRPAPPVLSRPVRPLAPQALPTRPNLDPSPRPFCDDPTASSFLAWIILVGAHEVSLGEVRKATSLSLFAATCLLARFADAGIVAKVRLPPRGAGRGRPKVRWRVDGARLARCSAVTSSQRVRRLPGTDGALPPNERTTDLRAKGAGHSKPRRPVAGKPRGASTSEH